MTAPTRESLVQQYAPLTGAEADNVLARLGDRDVDGVVAEVKAERAGPAAEWEDVEPIVSPVADEIQAVREALDDAAQKKIRDAGNDSDRALNDAARLRSSLEEINDYLIAASTVEEEEQANTLSDSDLASSSAADLVAYVKGSPEEADRVEAAENAREHRRKSVLDAIDDARSSE